MVSACAMGTIHGRILRWKEWACEELCSTRDAAAASEHLRWRAQCVCFTAWEAWLGYKREIASLGMCIARRHLGNMAQLHGAIECWQLVVVYWRYNSAAICVAEHCETQGMRQFDKL